MRANEQRRSKQDEGKRTRRPAGVQNIPPELWSQIARTIREMQPAYCVRG